MSNSSHVVRHQAADNASDAAGWLRLIRDPRWSAKQKRALLACFGQAAALYSQPVEQLALEPALQPKDKPATSEADIQADLAWLQQPQNHLLTLNDPRYPELLREIHDPPIALFATGDLQYLAEPKIAMVGSRRPSPVGHKIAHTLALDLAELGMVITSGMALGIDAIAHQAALQAQSPTIAIMGCGLDIVYPSRHRALFEQIAESGCLLSEYPLGTAPTKYSFPQRNRIVSGLSLGVIIVEAANRSGTLITARLATEHNRELMVVPGSALSAQYKGSNNLIKQGAAVVTDAADVIELLALPLRAALPTGVTDEEANTDVTPTHPLLEHLSDESTSIDQIIQSSGLTASEVSSMLLTLEVEGLIAMASDGGYQRLC